MKLVEKIVTWQGEGPQTGRRCLLLRFKNCNLNCPFCDTMYKNSTKEEQDISNFNIYNILQKEHLSFIMFTGGEPLLPSYQNQIIEVINSVGKSINIIIETNGTYLRDFLQQLYKRKINNNIYIQFSPKVFNPAYKVQTTYSQFRDILKETTNYVSNLPNVYIYYKLVISKYIDYLFLLETLLNYNIPNNNIYVMPEGETIEQITNTTTETIKIAKDYKVNFSSRLHIIHQFK